MKRLFRLYEIFKKMENLCGTVDWLFKEICKIDRRLDRAERTIERILAALEKADIKVGSGKGRYWDNTL